MKHKAVLITGGLGFIGSHVIEHLLKTTNYDFIILDKETYAGRRDNISLNASDKKRVKIILGDVTKKRIVEKAMEGVAIVIHMAADTHTGRSINKPYDSVYTNTMGTAVVLEAASKLPIERFIYISSSEVYGDQIEKIKMDEKHPLTPVSPYAVSKLAGERLAYSFYLTKQVPVIILRFFNAYGPRQHTEKAIPRFITSLMQNKPIIIQNGGKQTRDFVYVKDHVRAIEKILKAKPNKIIGQVFNIGTGKANSVEYIAKLILKSLKKNSSFLQISPSLKSETMGNVGISQKAKKVLGWEAQVSLEQGIKKTVLWYKKNKKWWKSVKQYK